MTFEEYNKKMNEYKERLSGLCDSDFDELLDEVSQFQYSYMENVLQEYQKTIDSKAKECIYELLSHAVKVSTSGSSVVDVETKEIADEIDKIIWEEIGDYLLDYDIYEENGHWVIDCMFGGNYIPEWEGWREE